METTWRKALTEGGVLGGAAGLGDANRVLALGTVHEHPDQPGDEVGNATRGQRIRDLIDRLGETPVDSFNLLKFKAGGEVPYRKYSGEFLKVLKKYAPETKIAYSGDCASLLIGDREWDRVIIVRYTSMKAFSSVIDSPEFAAIEHLRLEALERTMVYAVVPHQV